MSQSQDKQSGARRSRATESDGPLRRMVSARAHKARAIAAERVASMEVHAETTSMGTRRRSGVVAIAGVGALGFLFSMVSANVMAVDFTSANSTYKVYTDRVVGQYAAGYVSNQTRQDGVNAPVAQIGFKSADLYGLCTITTQSLFDGGPDVSLIITGGESVNGTVTGSTTSSDKITANELYLASNTLKGKGENISRMTLGQSASTLSMDDITSHRGQPGNFGLQAELMQIGDLDADAYGIDLKGSINLPNLSIRVVPGAATKSACA